MQVCLFQSHSTHFSLQGQVRPGFACNGHSLASKPLFKLVSTLLAERSEKCVCEKKQTCFLPVVEGKESYSLDKVIGWARQQLGWVWGVQMRRWQQTGAVHQGGKEEDWAKRNTDLELFRRMMGRTSWARRFGCGWGEQEAKKLFFLKPTNQYHPPPPNK